jgi:hypothetical protein
VPPHNLSGTVTSDEGAALPGIYVSFGDQGTVTNRLGRWYISAADGSHPLQFTPDTPWTDAFPGEPTWAPATYPTPVTVTGGEGSEGLDVTLVRSVTSTAAPVVTGTAAVGRTLTASPGTWVAPSGTTFTTEWLRDGVVVSTGATRVLTPADAGRSLVARVTATYGLAVTSASSTARAVSRLATTTTAKGRSTKPKRVKIKALVSASGLTPTGTVTILRGRKVVRSGVALVGGRVTVVLRGQRSGRARYVVRFDGATQTLPSASPRFRVKVR